jgi:uncharacterized protein YndB with AHSA1/START domain
MMIAVEPLTFNVAVPLSQSDAFDLFTRRIHTWWPLATHSISEANVDSVRIEPFAGGRIVETSRAGEEHVWGEVLAFERPRRLLVTWHPGGGPPTEVQVTFTPAGDEETRVELVHRGWEVFGEGAEEARSGYANGWPGVFGEHYVNAARTEATSS